jgi:hypothetical protein
VQALQKQGECLDWWWILALHLLPGLLIGATLVLLARMLAPSGTPANLALLLAMLLVAVPIELGGPLWLHAGTAEHGA